MSFITGLTDTQLRASTVPVSLTSTTITGSVSITGALTDTQLRATAVPVSLTSTTITGTVTVSGALTDTQLRASAVPVSLTSTTITGNVAITAASLPLPSGAATNAILTGGTATTRLTDGTNTVAVATGSIAASETTVDRLKVNASLRVLDTAQAAGSQLVAAKGDQTTGLWVNVKNTSVAVTGTFFQATQPVSGTVTVGNASLAVTGTFWQATQPVSIATMPSTPVTGTFWQATQPVSGTVTAAQADTNGSGTISATDALAPAPGGAGALISTAPTANSFVAMAIPGGGSQVDVQITGTATGTYYFEHSMDSTTGSDGSWIATNFRQTGVVNTVLGYSATTNGVFRGNAAGFKWVRVRNVGGTTPSNPVIIRVSNGSGTTFLNASLPAGTNNIGLVGLAAGAAAIGSVTIGAAIPAGANVIGALTANQSVNVAQMGGVATTMGSGVTGAGVQRVVLATDVALPAGTNAIGAVTATPATPASTGSLINSAATTNAQNVKNTAGQLYSVTASNSGAAAAFVKIYNLNVAPTVGTSAIALTIPVPASSAINIPLGALGVRFTNGISLAITNLVGEADATAVAANQVKVLVSYI